MTHYSLAGTFSATHSSGFAFGPCFGMNNDTRTQRMINR